MKKSILFFVFFAVVLCVPALARADFFNDGNWYMNSSLWEESSIGNVSGTEFVDQHNRLEWNTAPGWNDGHEIMRFYGSKWALDLNHDFEINAEFHYGYTATQGNDNDYGTVLMGLFSKGPPEPSNGFAIGASSDVNYLHDPVKKFWTSEMVNGEQIEGDSWERLIDSGVFYARYNSTTDTLQLEAQSGITNFTGLKSELGLTQLGVIFAGDSNGASLSSGDAYLSNFNLVKGTVTPEPVSCALFLLGGGALLAVRRFRRKA